MSPQVLEMMYSSGLTIHWLKMSSSILKSSWDWFALFDDWFIYMLSLVEMRMRVGEKLRRRSQFHLSISDNQQTEVISRKYWLREYLSVMNIAWNCRVLRTPKTLRVYPIIYNKSYQAFLLHQLYYTKIVTFFFSIMSWIGMCYWTSRFLESVLFLLLEKIREKNSFCNCLTISNLKCTLTTSKPDFVLFMLHFI